MLCLQPSQEGSERPSAVTPQTPVKQVNRGVGTNILMIITLHPYTIVVLNMISVVKHLHFVILPLNIVQHIM